MKKLIQGGIITVSAFLFFLALSGCGLKPLVVGSGVPVSGTVEIESATRISVSDTCVVTITQGTGYSMEVEIDDNVLEYVKVEEIDGSLDVSLSPLYLYSDITFIVDITVPNLEEVALSGASKGYLGACVLPNDLSIQLSGASSFEAVQVDSLDLTVDISGASSLTGAFGASDTYIDISGASTAELRGSTADLSIDGSGASSLYLSEYESVKTDIELSGASYGEIFCSGWMDLVLSGASTLYYLGSPTLGRVDISGGSSMVPLTVK